jgi:8-oxo-dGTP pyrophosphatase MutT (NUDIX family)
MQKGIDYIGISVVYFCHDGKGNFVMGRRTQNARDEKERWDIGGGAAEVSETVEETLKKEILEEYCAEVLSFEFLGFRDVLREINGKKTHWVALDYKVLVNPKTVGVGEPHKIDKVEWFTSGAIPKEGELHSQLPKFLEKYQDRLWN